ncbi:MAG: beta-galactosidase [Ruminococcaceae bacterium]|nr:beta-galactosidase [Oscillospiraceae bacterium]
MKNRLTTTESSFLLDGKEFFIRSGAIHYFRIPREYWEERLLQLKSCGFNTVETYSPWNLHEKTKGNFDFSGMLDVKAFLDTAAKVGLYAIVRPGPYICAEWDFGGFPAWLLADDNIRLRCFSEPYMTHVRSYLAEYIERIKPCLSENGGNVIALQIENEYGSYGNDSIYMDAVRKIYGECGVKDTFLFTSDGPNMQLLLGGTLPDVHAVGNFGSNAKANLAELKRIRPNAPLMCGEYWDGWFDHWGVEHHGRDTKSVADDLSDMLGMGASFNFYMFNGGTNFGFMNGANTVGSVGKEKYMPTVSSYDYDCIINEWGGYTEKYRAVRKNMEEYLGEKLPEPPEEPARRGYGRVCLDKGEGFIDSFKKYAKHHTSAYPEPMEKYGQNYGYIVYETHLKGPLPQRDLVFPEIHDKAYVYADGKLIGSVYRNDDEKRVTLPSIPEEGMDITILVQNMGRVNYGRILTDRKGITAGVLLEFQYIFGWDVYTLELEDVPSMDNAVSSAGLTGASFLKGELYIDEKTPLCHTFLKTEGFKKGYACVNGFNLGRFNCDGPTKTLFVPACLLKHGVNEVYVFEQEDLEGVIRNPDGHPLVEFLREPQL